RRRPCRTVSTSGSGTCICPQSRTVRSSGRSGTSAGAVTIQPACGWCFKDHSMPARMPAKGPSRRPSRRACRWTSAGSPMMETPSAFNSGAGSLATTTRSITCGARRSTTWTTMGLPARCRNGLGTPGPMRLPSPPASTTPTKAPARTGPKLSSALTAMGALCEALGRMQGEERMAMNIAKAANWLHSVNKARAVVGWWPAQHMPEDERTAYKVQDAFLKKLVPKQGPVVGYKIGLTAPPIWEQTGLRSPAYGPIRKKRVFQEKTSVRADRWTRLGVELEIILTVNADVPAPKGKDYDKESIAPYVGEAQAGFELIEDRGADYSRLPAFALIMDVGWNGGSLLARPNRNWRNLDLANLEGSISF